MIVFTCRHACSSAQTRTGVAFRRRQVQCEGEPSNRQLDLFCQNWTSSSWEDVGSVSDIYLPGYGIDAVGGFWKNCHPFRLALLCVQQPWYAENPVPH